MGAFILPKACIKEIERMCNRYLLWNGNIYKKGGMVKTRNLRRKEADDKEDVSSPTGVRKSARHHRLGVSSNPENIPLSQSQSRSAGLRNPSNNRKKRSRGVSESPSVKKNLRRSTISRKGDHNEQVSRSVNEDPNTASEPPPSPSTNATPSVSSSYNVSGGVSDDRDEEYTSVDPSLSSSEDGVDADRSDEQRLPKRLFSTDRYPTEGRVNCYSKPQYLVDILSILDGTDELKTLKQSPFTSLFDLPVRRCSLSGKLIHNFLSRQLVTKNPYELWFTFGGYPIRFSLEEFHKNTGLPCGPYLDNDNISAAQIAPDSPSHFWYTLVGPDKEMSIEDIVTKLKNEPNMPEWRKLRLSLIVIVEGVLSCGTQPIRPSFSVVEMVRNLDLFFAYPWGRHSFERTIRMVKVGNVIRRQSLILKKLKQPSLVLHGFPMALQLMLFKSVPLLLRYLPYKDDLQTFYDRRLAVLASLKTYHTDNILHVENDKQLSVSHTVSFLPTEVDNVLGGVTAGDPHVAHMLRLLQEGYKFCKADWLGGDDCLDKLCICNKKKHRRCKCGSSGAGEHYSAEAGGTSNFTCSNNEEIPKLRLEVDLQKNTASMITNMRLELLSEMKILLSSHHFVRCGVNGTPGHVGTENCGTDVPPDAGRSGQKMYH